MSFNPLLRFLPFETAAAGMTVCKSCPEPQAGARWVARAPGNEESRTRFQTLLNPQPALVARGSGNTAKPVRFETRVASTGSLSGGGGEKLYLIIKHVFII